MSATKLVYKIRNPAGLFSKGGVYPVFTLTGKAWSSRGALGGHLALVAEGKARHLYKDCEIVSFEISTKEGAAETVSSWFEEKARRDKLRQEKKVAQAKRFHETWERETLAKLKQKYEPGT